MVWKHLPASQESCGSNIGRSRVFDGLTPHSGPSQSQEGSHADLINVMFESDSDDEQDSSKGRSCPPRHFATWQIWYLDMLCSVGEEISKPFNQNNNRAAAS